MARNTDKWATQAQTVFDCSDLSFRSLAELEEYANGLVFATQSEIACLGALATDVALTHLYAVHRTMHTRYQIAKFLSTSVASDYATVEGVRSATAKLQFISRILDTKVRILQDKITAISLLRFPGKLKLAQASASFLDEGTGELSQFVREGSFWTVTTFNKQGQCGKTRVLSVIDPSGFDKNGVQ